MRGKVLWTRQRAAWTMTIMRHRGVQACQAISMTPSLRYSSPFLNRA